jgi:hypothetical protein
VLSHKVAMAVLVCSCPGHWRLAPRRDGGAERVAAEQEVTRRGDGSEHIRRKGAGRKKSTDQQPTLIVDLERLVDPGTRGDPESPLRWTSKSVRKLADELQHRGHRVSYETVAGLLRQMDYSLQANRKPLEGDQHADRDAQFEHINAKARQYLADGNPVISVDTKKKEQLGDFKNGGCELRPKGKPEKVRVHDFQIPELGKVAPYGVYDLGRNVGRVNVGVDHDTAAFAVASLRGWWYCMGLGNYAEARKLLITADSGGSNGARVSSGNGNCKGWPTKPV